ncbi:MAG: hypothetical protein ACTII7_07865 [Galactobacter sp.]
MQPKTIGKVTISSATGATIGAALATIIVWILARAGVDAADLQDPLTIILTAGLGVLGGYVVPPANDPGTVDDPTITVDDGDEYTGPDAGETDDTPVPADYEPRHSA